VYFPPRNPTTKQVRPQKEPKYNLVTPVIPPGVIVEGDMLGLVGSLIFLDHDLADIKKFPELAPDNYLRTSLKLDSLIITVESKGWATILQRTSILNLLEIPHFGRST